MGILKGEGEKEGGRGREGWGRESGESEEVEGKGGRGSEEGWGKGRQFEVRGREGRCAMERLLRFIPSHQNYSAWNNSEDGNKIMSEIHFLPLIL